jgi:hypothetical protein
VVRGGRLLAGSIAARASSLCNIRTSHDMQPPCTGTESVRLEHRHTIPFRLRPEFHMSLGNFEWSAGAGFLPVALNFEKLPPCAFGESSDMMPRIVINRAVAVNAHEQHSAMLMPSVRRIQQRPLPAGIETGENIVHCQDGEISLQREWS